MCISFVSIGYETMTVIRARTHVQSSESALLKGMTTCSFNNFNAMVQQIHRKRTKTEDYRLWTQTMASNKQSKLKDIVDK